LDVVIGKGTAILELLAGKDKPLLVWGNSFLVLDLSFDIINSVRAFDLQSDGFSCQGFHEDLHLERERRASETIAAGNLRGEIEEEENAM
jgi:hypothetical protein